MNENEALRDVVARFDETNGSNLSDMVSSAAMMDNSPSQMAQRTFNGWKRGDNSSYAVFILGQGHGNFLYDLIPPSIFVIIVMLFSY